VLSHADTVINLRSHFLTHGWAVHRQFLSPASALAYQHALSGLSSRRVGTDSGLSEWTELAVPVDHGLWSAFGDS
jgi:hypothetical protein